MEGQGVTTEKHPDGSSTTYNENGQKLGFKDVDGSWWNITYDERGNKTSFENSMGYWEEITYNERNRFERYVNSERIVKNYIYDGSGNLVNIEYLRE